MMAVDPVQAMRDAMNMMKPKVPCQKVNYYTPAAAKKALRTHGQRTGCKSWYRCPHHGTEEIYHLTSRND
jgi:hypothetical protein